MSRPTRTEAEVEQAGSAPPEPPTEERSRARRQAESDGAGFPMARVGKHTLIYGTGIVLNKALAFVMLPLYTRVLTPEDYGVMGLIDMTLDVIAIMAGHKMVQGLYRFYHKAPTEPGRRSVVSTVLLTMAGSFAVVSLLAFLVAGVLSATVFGTDEHGGLIRLAAGGLAFQALLLVALAYARVQDRSVLFVSANAVKLVFAAGLNVLFLVFMGMGVTGVFLSTLITNALVGLALAGWVARDAGLHFSPAVFRNLVRYGLPLVVMQFATFISTFGDRYFLQEAAGEGVVGLYHLAYKFGFLLVVVGFSPFTQVWEPKRFEIWKRPDRDELLGRGFLYANVLLFTVALGIGVLVGPMLRIMSDAAFHEAAYLVPPILAAYVLHSWARIQDIGILVRERTEFIAIAEWIAAAVAVAAYWLLIPRYLAWGAVAATLLCFSVRYGLIYTFSQRLAPVRYPWGAVLKVAALTVGIVGGSLLLPEMGLALSIGLRSVLIAAYGLLLWTAPILPDAERERIRRLARQAWEAARLRWGERAWPKKEA